MTADRPVFHGRRMIVAAFVMGFCSGPGQSFTFSVFQPFLLESFGISRGTFAGIYAAGSLFSAVVASLTGRLTDAVGIRRTLYLVAVGMALACFGMLLSRELISLSVALALLRALGQGTLTLLGSLLVMQWYVRRRGGAMSLAGLGVSLAGAALPPLCLAAIQGLGWRATYGWIGVVELVLLALVATLLVRNRPEDLGQSPDGDGVASPAPRKKIDRRVFRSGRFWLLALSLASSPFVVTALVFHQSSIFEDHGIGRATAATMLSLIAAAAAGATLATGRLVDRFGVRRTLRAVITCQVAALATAHLLTPGPVVWIYSLLIGAIAGSSGVMAGVTWARFYGREGLGTVQGSAGTVILTAAAVAPLPLGLLRDLSGSHTIGLTVCLIAPLGSLWLLTRELEPH